MTSKTVEKKTRYCHTCKKETQSNDYNNECYKCSGMKYDIMKNNVKDDDDNFYKECEIKITYHVTVTELGSNGYSEIISTDTEFEYYPLVKNITEEDINKKDNTVDIYDDNMYFYQKYPDGSCSPSYKRTTWTITKAKVVKKRKPLVLK